MQGFTALRADDPAAAVQSFTAALAMPAAGADEGDDGTRREVLQTLARARILAGDAEIPRSGLAGTGGPETQNARGFSNHGRILNISEIGLTVNEPVIII